MSENSVNPFVDEFNILNVKTEPPEEILPGTTQDNVDLEVETNLPILGIGVKKEDGESSWDDIGEYYFESDHLALKGNADYHNLLKVVCLLQSQKIQAIKDIERLKESMAEAKSDPITFVNHIARKENLNLPKPQPVAKLPNIDWRKYTVGPKIPIFVKRYEVQDAAEEIPRRQLVRGRLCTDTKPATFNQLWTSEEQQKLEELLIEFPPEEVENRRWHKIASALGNRTTQQVASRVQKYFIKLSKAGLPVPGRMPSITSIRKQGNQRKNSTRQLLQLSSFFKHRVPPVYMPETDDSSNFSFSSDIKLEPPSSENSNTMKRMENTVSICVTPSDVYVVDTNYSLELQRQKSKFLQAEFEDIYVDEKLANTAEYQELVYLKKLRQEKLKQGLVQHFGFQCDRCGVDPITGTRWHCTVCDNDSVDLCEECMECSYEFGSHTADHNMEPVYHVQGSKPYLDRDYMHLMGGDYNYLDPNYMPSL